MRLLERIFSDSLGDMSSMRILVFIVVCVILFNWTYINIITGQMNDLGINELGGIVGALGVKAVQKFIENRNL